MENQTPINYKRKFSAILIFAIIFMFIGRNLSFIPKVDLSQTGNEKLKNETQGVIKNKPGFYSIYYKNLKNNDFFGINEHQIETGASVNKMPIIASLYYLANKREINLDEKITIQKSEVQDYGTGSLRYQSFPLTISLRNLAKLSLQESDNTAAHVLDLRVGTDKIQGLVKSWGMKQTDMTNNKTTVFDMSILFEKIYEGEIANETLTKEFMGFMKDTDFEDRLPKSLPKSAKVYHKTGDGEGFVHDLGIIETEKGVYFLGVMTSDIGNSQTQTENTIAQVSKKIFDTLND